jgi:HK97 family phage major capsid protein/HK97 family phage prohead protease
MTDKIAQPPKENLVRAVYPAVELRSTEDDTPVLEGHFAKFNEWTEIDSVWEGRFMERIAPGAFRKTFAENRERIRPLFQHGQDPQVGDKPLGPIEELEEDEQGARYKVPLLDTSYNRDLIPGLKAGLYGSSFRFSVVKEDFDKKPQRSASNPEGIPERTIREARVFEFGPVTFPAYAGATASVRSMTDVYTLNRFVRDPERLAEIMDTMRSTALPTDGAAAEHSDEGSRSEPPPAQPPPAVAATSTQDPPERGSSAVKEHTVNTIEERQSRISEIGARLQEIQAEHGVDVLPDAVQAEWDQLTDERATHETAVAAYESRMAVLQKASTSERNVERIAERTVRTSTATRVPENVWDLAAYRGLSTSPEMEKQAYRDGAMKALDSASFAHERANENESKSHIERLLAKDNDGVLARHILATGNPVYQRAFAKLLAGRPFSSEEQRAIATVGSSLLADGGYAVPYTLDPTLILTSDGQINPLRSMARVETLTQGNTWKGVTTAGISVSRVAEETAVDPTTPVLAQPSVTVQAVKAEIQFSIEADEDWPRLQAEMARLFQDAKDAEEAEQFVNGNGNGTTGNPEGIVAGLAASSDVGTTGDGFDIEDVHRLINALPDRFEPRAQFLGHRAVYSAIAQFGNVANAGAGAVWQTMGQGRPAQLLGYPARYSSAMESDYTTDGNDILLFGDFRAGFIIVDKVGLTVEIDPHVRNGDGKWTGQRALLMHYRNNSMVLVDNALRILKVGVVTS